MLRLPPHRLFPGDARARRGRHRSPARIPAGSGCGRYPRSAAAGARRACAREIEIEQRRQRMAEMQIAVRGRRKAENGWRHSASVIAAASSPAKRRSSRRRHALHASSWIAGSTPGAYDSRMTHFLHTQADLAIGLARSCRPTRGSRRCWRRPAHPALRRGEPGFPGLAAIVCGQQLSTASAGAIWGRLQAAFDPFHHDALRRARADRLGAARPVRRQDQVDQGDRRRDRQRRDSTSTRSRNSDADAAHAALTGCTASGRGPPTSICCSASAMPTPGRPATSPCRKRRASRSA